MTWDKFKVAQRFLQKANAIHPEEEGNIDRRERALAIQNVYYDCYMSSFSREELIRRLREAIGGKIELPEGEEVNDASYRVVYIQQAREVLLSLETGEYM